MVIWSTGMCVAPYIRALKETRPVMVALIDARSIHVYRYAEGKLDSLTTVHAHATIDAPTHIGNVQRSGFHPGVRGDTTHDVVQRARAAGTERMLREAEDLIPGDITLDTAILVGGTPRIASGFRRSFGSSVVDRALQLESLHADASDAEITEAAKTGGSAIRDAADLRQLAGIIDSDATGGLGALGPDATRRALERQAVRELYVTGRFVEDHMVEAEDAVRHAFDQGATVELVSRSAAVRLDAHGGVAARLRYHLRPEGGGDSETEPNVALQPGSSS